MTTIRVLEANVSGNKHSMFNASFLKMLSIIAPKGKLFFYAEETHKNCIKEFLKSDGDVLKLINFSIIKIVDKGRFLLPIKFIFEIYNTTRILFKYRKEDYLLILTSISQFSNFIIKLIKLFFPKTKMLFVIHGELEFIKKHDQQTFLLKLWGWFLKYSFKIKTDSNTFYLVLGDIIKTNMEKYNLVDLNKVLSIDHPCLYTSSAQKANKEKSILKIGAIGVASLQKKSQYIFDIGDKIIEKGKSNIKLEIIGKILPNTYKYLREGVIYSTKNVMIDQKTFDKKIAQLDFSLFFYDNTYYELCASGAFFDALNHEIPMLGLKNDFFIYYFNKYGSMGYLFDDVNELIDFVIVYNKSHDENYNSFIDNMKDAKNDLNISNLAIKFHDMLLSKKMLNKISLQ